MPLYIEFWIEDTLRTRGIPSNGFSSVVFVLVFVTWL